MRTYQHYLKTIANLLIVGAMLIPSQTASARPPAEPGGPAGIGTCPWAAIPPNIDGIVDPGEWDKATSFSISHGKAYFKNDGTYLYILEDLTGDTGNDSLAGDYFNITFDVDKDLQIDADVDLDFRIAPDPYPFSKAYYQESGELGANQATKSTFAAGFGLSALPGDAGSHRIWEVKIYLSEIGAAPGQALRMGFHNQSITPLPGFNEYSPIDYRSDFSMLNSVILADINPSPWTRIAPTIDGSVSPGEWSNGVALGLTHGTVYFQNDATNLYILMDMVGDDGNDLPTREDGDFFGMIFDANRNGAIDDDIDLMYALNDGSFAMGYYHGRVARPGPTSSNMAFGFHTSPWEDSQSHRIWEFAIRLSEIGAAPGGQVRFGLFNRSISPLFEDAFPPDLQTNFANYIRLNLSSAPVSPWADKAPVIDGEAAASEWAGAHWMATNYGRIYFQNDATNLYVLMDMTADTEVSPGDFYCLTFDVNKNANIDTNVDINYRPNVENLGLQKYLGPGSLTGPGETASELHPGFGPTLGTGTDHQFWELAIRLTEIGAAPGNTVRMGVLNMSDAPLFTSILPNLAGDEFPFLYDFRMLPEITLSNPAVYLPFTVR